MEQFALMKKKCKERWRKFYYLKLTQRYVKIIAANEVVNISKEDRELLIYNSWGLDETDKEFYLLPTDLRKELLDFDEPQENIMSSKYDKLVKISCESSYKQYTNEKIEAIQRNQSIHYYHRDEQLNTAFMTAQNGEIQNHFRYDA